MHGLQHGGRPSALVCRGVRTKSIQSALVREASEASDCAEVVLAAGRGRNELLQNQSGRSRMCPLRRWVCGEGGVAAGIGRMSALAESVCQLARVLFKRRWTAERVIWQREETEMGSYACLNAWIV